MIQQGQVFKLKTKGPDRQPLWAYRYRLEGRGSERPQVGGFATRAEAEKALRKVLDRLGPGGGRATITLAEFVDEYLEMHQAAPVTIAKLRWLLCKATAEFGEKRLADLSPMDVYAWRVSIPEGHRFEATQALRQVLNRAVAWGLIDYNPTSSAPQGRELLLLRAQATRHRRRRSVVVQIGTLNEGALHAQLKEWYRRPGDLLEQVAGGFVVDLVRGDLLVEIQTGGFAPLRRKLELLAQEHPVRPCAPAPR